MESREFRQCRRPAPIRLSCTSNDGISGGAKRRPLHADVSLESHLRCNNLNVLLFLLVERHMDQCLRLGEIYLL